MCRSSLQSISLASVAGEFTNETLACCWWQRLKCIFESFLCTDTAKIPLVCVHPILDVIKHPLHGVVVWRIGRQRHDYCPTLWDCTRHLLLILVWNCRCVHHQHRTLVVDVLTRLWDLKANGITCMISLGALMLSPKFRLTLLYKSYSLLNILLTI